jgi:hypothetical protein
MVDTTYSRLVHTTSRTNLEHLKTKRRARQVKKGVTPDPVEQAVQRQPGLRRIQYTYAAGVAPELVVRSKKTSGQASAAPGAKAIPIPGLPGQEG